jgi:preprotein translocase subunit SecG
MYALMVLLTVIYVIACLFLCFVVLIQKGEGGGLGGAFGGGAVDVAFGAKADMTWKRATAVCAAVFMLLAMFLGVLHHRLDQRSIAEDAARQEEAAKKALEAEKKAETPATTETQAPGGSGPGLPGGSLTVPNDAPKTTEQPKTPEQGG